MSTTIMFCIEIRKILSGYHLFSGAMTEHFFAVFMWVSTVHASICTNIYSKQELSSDSRARLNSCQGYGQTGE